MTEDSAARGQNGAGRHGRDPIDPTGVIAESYRIEGISLPECRSIFLDWVLGLKPPAEPSTALPELLARHAEGREDHPMTTVLRDAMGGPGTPARRGGRAGRLARD